MSTPCSRCSLTTSENFEGTTTLSTTTRIEGSSGRFTNRPQRPSARSPCARDGTFSQTSLTPTRASPADEPLASPVIENAVGRHVVRTRLRDGVAAVSIEALAYLGSFWESMGDVSGEESFTYGWGIGHPEHSVADHLHEVVPEELFWVRGVLPHTFYADQHAAADLLEALLTAERIDYEDRYMLASILAKVDHDSTPKIPRYWDLREELDYRFEWDETVRARLREAIETEGFHERLPENWTFGDMEV
jgi:hypothetical protein